MLLHEDSRYALTFSLLKAFNIYLFSWFLLISAIVYRPIEDNLSLVQKVKTIWFGNIVVKI